MAKIEDLMEIINKDIEKLDSSNLEQADAKSYFYFQKQLKQLLQRCTIMNNDSSLTLLPNTYLSLLSDWSKISAKIDFYLDFEGGKELIAKYQIARIKEDLRNILRSISFDNVEIAKAKLKEYLTFCENVFVNSADMTERKILVSKVVEVRDLIKKLEYQIYKYENPETRKLPNDLKEYTSLVVADIKNILKDKQISAPLKNELKKYLVDVSVIEKSFDKVVRLIMIASSNPNITEEELNSLLYVKPKKENKTRTYIAKDLTGTQDNVNDYIKKYKYFEDLVDIYIKYSEYDSIIVLWDKYKNKTDSDVSYLIAKLVEDDAPFDYVIEGIIANSSRVTQKDLIDLRRELEKYGEEYVSILDDAVVMYKEKIWGTELIPYIRLSVNEDLIAYILTIKDSNDYYMDTINTFIIEYGLTTNNPIMVAAIESRELIDFKHFFEYNLSDEVRVQYLNKYFNKKEIPDEKKQKTLIELYFRVKNDYFKNYIIVRMLEYNDASLFFKLFDTFVLNGVGKFDMNKVLEVLAFIPESKLKEKVLDYLYGNSNAISFEVSNARSLDSLKNMNMFEAYYMSSKKLYASEYLDLARQFGNSRLNWGNILIKWDNSYNLQYEELLRLFYKNNRSEFLKIVEVKSLNKCLVKELISEIPSAIRDFISLLDMSEILELGTITKEAFVSYYEEEMAQGKISITDKTNLVLGSDNKEDILKLLVYIWIKGLLNADILIYKDKLKPYIPLILDGLRNIQNAYLKPSYILSLTDGMDIISEEYGSIMFMTENDKNEILNSNEDSRIKNIRMRKYYGDLLKLLKKAQGSIFAKIVLEIAKSKIKEYIVYLRDNYPESIDIILSYITDIDILNIIIEDTPSLENLPLERKKEKEK